MRILVRNGSTYEVYLVMLAVPDQLRIIFRVVAGDYVIVSGFKDHAQVKDVLFLLYLNGLVDLREFGSVEYLDYFSCGGELS